VQSTSDDQIRKTLWEMDRVQECQVQRGREHGLHDDEGNLLDIPSSVDPEQQLMEEQRLALQARLFMSTDMAMLQVHGVFARMDQALERSGAMLELDDDQRFILQATLDGVHTEERMGQLLGGLTVRQVRYRRQQAIDKMRKLLEASDIQLSDLVDE
jgi:hypothetical protein